VKNRTTVERKSDREVVVTRTINGPARIVFEAFTKAELLKRWWVPKSMGMTLLSCEVDARVGGKYRLVFDHRPEPVAFFGTYVEVKPYSRLAWTNDEGGEGGSVTTVTFEEKAGISPDCRGSWRSSMARIGAYTSAQRPCHSGSPCRVELVSRHALVFTPTRLPSRRSRHLARNTISGRRRMVVRQLPLLGSERLHCALF
jgi:uncharacterized protein YndB with AHSA1/START domain